MIQDLNPKHRPTIDVGAPYHRPNDPWTDVVVQASATGLNKDTVAIRDRSLRQKRRIFTWSVTAFLCGSMLILLTSPYRMELLAPGGLTTAHGQILAAQGSDRCAACHSAAEQSFAGWVSSTLWGSPSDRPTQSQRCLKCHEKTMRKEFALKPHGVADSQLQAASARARSRSTSGQVNLQFRPPLEDGEIACSACHREHHGADANLAALTDAQCQVCHQNQMQAFEVDHPQFHQYGASRRSRIAFDHSTHAEKYFPEATQAFNCNQCHLDDSGRNVKQLASFEQGCAQCHDQKLRDSSQAGLTLLALPMLDMEAIESEGLNVGTWPLAATGDFDGPLPTLMRVLLAADPQASPTIERLGSEFDFAAIDPDDPESIADAVTLAWAIKRLIHDLATAGTTALEQRLESQLNIEITPDQLAAVRDNLSRQSIQQTARRWLPQLHDEISSRSAAATVAQPKLLPEPAPFRQPDSDQILAMLVQTLPAVRNQVKQRQRDQSQPSPDNDDQASTQLAVNPLKQLLKRSAAGSRPAEAAPQKLGNELDNSEPLTNVDRIKHSANRQDDPLADALSTPAQRPPQQALGTSRSLALDRSDGMPVTEPARINQAGDSATTIASKFPDDPPAAATGWIRDDRVFQLRYVPQGHADRALTQWTDWIAASQEAPNRQSTSPLFEQLMSTAGPGGCRQCHTADQFTADHLDRWDQLSSLTQSPADVLFNRSAHPGLTLQREGQPAGHESISMNSVATKNPEQSMHVGENPTYQWPALKVNWKTRYRDPQRPGFTRFSHAPHLILPSLQDCQQCHEMISGRSNRDSFAGFDSNQVQSNFAPLRVADCASCHRQESDTNGCTQCHQYHVHSSR